MAVKKLLLAKEEVTYGTDPTPDQTNAIETMDLEVERYAGDRVQRDVDRLILGGKDQININPHASYSFGVPLAGSGTAGDAPAHGILWKACGFDETLDAGVDAEYQLPSAQSDLVAADSVTFYDYRDQIELQQIVSGVRGSVAIEMNRGSLPRINFSNMLGSYTRPTSVGEPTVASWAAWQTEVPFTNSNVTTLTLDGESACTDSFNIDFGIEVARRNLPGCNQTVITGYEITGNMTIVAPAVATKNWYQAAESDNGVTSVAYRLVYGTTAGNIVQLDSDDVSITNITEGESAEGDLTFTFDLSFKDQPIVRFL